MRTNHVPTLVGGTLLTPSPVEPIGDYVNLLSETFYKIQHYDAMPPFFMSIVSGADYWLYITSTGGPSAGPGAWPDVVTACHDTIQIAGKVEHNPDTFEVYRHSYQIYRELYPLLKHTFTQLI